MYYPQWLSITLKIKFKFLTSFQPHFPTSPSLSLHSNSTSLQWLWQVGWLALSTHSNFPLLWLNLAPALWLSKSNGAGDGFIPDYQPGFMDD